MTVPRCFLHYLRLSFQGQRIEGEIVKHVIVVRCESSDHLHGMGTIDLPKRSEQSS